MERQTVADRFMVKGEYVTFPPLSVAIHPTAACILNRISLCYVINTALRDLQQLDRLSLWSIVLVTKSLDGQKHDLLHDNALSWYCNDGSVFALSDVSYSSVSSFETLTLGRGVDRSIDIINYRGERKEESSYSFAFKSGFGDRGYCQYPDRGV